MNFRALRTQRVTTIWLLLLAITAASGWLAGGTGHEHSYTGVAIVVLAFIKIRFVILDFMEIRNAPPKMRMACEAWVIILCAILVMLDLQ